MQTSAALPGTSAAALEISALEGNIQGFYLGALLLILGFSGLSSFDRCLFEESWIKRKRPERIRAGNVFDDYFEMFHHVEKKVYTQS